MSDKKVLIEVKDLCKSFGNVNVLNGISTEIAQGEVVAIIGPSGCGKSTFLRSLNLLEEPTSGVITFEGTDITDKSVHINKNASEDWNGIPAVQSVPELYRKRKYHAGTGSDRTYE